MIAEKRAQLDEKAQAHVVRFQDVEPDWSNFSKIKMPNNDRAVYQYLGPDGHGNLPSWALPAERFGLSLILLPPGQGAPAHTHETDEYSMRSGRVLLAVRMRETLALTRCCRLGCPAATQCVRACWASSRLVHSS